MKEQIRRGTFETNSSSTHSISICTEDKFTKWKNGELLYDEDTEEFVPTYSLSDEDKLYAKENYEIKKDEYSKDWDDLSDDAKEKYYRKYAKENCVDTVGLTYEDWLDEKNCYFETYTYRYKTEHNDKIVAFGYYGHD